MCLIIHKPADVSIPFGIIANGLLYNNDGIGAMIRTDQGVQVHRSLTDKIKPIKKFLSDFEANEMVIHLRMGTHGTISLDNTHPYSVLTQEEHGHEVWMMHNGVLGSYGVPKSDRSDTWHFIEETLRPLLARDLSLLYSPEFQRLLSDRLGASNKLVFWGAALPDPIVINERFGITHAGCWFSNTYAWDAHLFVPGIAAPQQTWGSYMGGGYTGGGRSGFAKSPSGTVSYGKEATKSNNIYDNQLDAYDDDAVLDALDNWDDEDALEFEYEQEMDEEAMAAAAALDKYDWGFFRTLNTEQINLMGEDELMEAVLQCPEGAASLIREVERHAPWVGGSAIDAKYAEQYPYEVVDLLLEYATAGVLD